MNTTPSGTRSTSGSHNRPPIAHSDGIVGDKLRSRHLCFWTHDGAISKAHSAIRSFPDPFSTSPGAQFSENSPKGPSLTAQNVPLFLVLVDLRRWPKVPQNWRLGFGHLCDTPVTLPPRMPGGAGCRLTSVGWCQALGVEPLCRMHCGVAGEDLRHPWIEHGCLHSCTAAPTVFLRGMLALLCSSERPGTHDECECVVNLRAATRRFARRNKCDFV